LHGGHAAGSPPQPSGGGFELTELSNDNYEHNDH
jgi:hypothetical protein